MLQAMWAEPKDSFVYMFYMEVFQAWSQPIKQHMDVYTGQLYNTPGERAASL